MTILLDRCDLFTYKLSERSVQNKTCSKTNCCAVLLEQQFYQNIQKCSCSYWVRECSTSAGSVMIQNLLETGKLNTTKDGNALEK